MSRGFSQPIVRQEIGAAVSNALVGFLLAVVVGFAPTLTWLFPVTAGFSFGVAAVSDRDPEGTTLSVTVIGLVVMLFAGLWFTGRPVLGAVPLVLLGTSLGFGGNRFVFGVIMPVPELRRERASD